MFQKSLLSLTIFLLASWVVVTPATAQPSGYIDTSFAACQEKITEIPPGFDIDPQEVAGLFHGVWLGSRESWASNVSAQPADYVMIIDVNNRESMTYEFRGQGVVENRFRNALPAAQPGAPEFSNFYCGGSLFGPFRDRFVKVSDQPVDGLRALSTVTGIASNEQSIFDVLVAFRQAGHYDASGGNEVNAAFYTMALTPIEGTGGRVLDNIRLDLVGQIIAASGQASDGQPQAGHEGGYFHGVQTGQGRYLAAFSDDAYADPALATSVGFNGGVYVSCNGLNAADNPDQLFALDPLHEFAYTKVVVGPLQ